MAWSQSHIARLYWKFHDNGYICFAATLRDYKQSHKVTNIVTNADDQKQYLEASKHFTLFRIIADAVLSNSHEHRSNSEHV